MDINLQLYRIRIGHFCSTRQNKISRSIKLSPLIISQAKESRNIDQNSNRKYELLISSMFWIILLIISNYSNSLLLTNPSSLSQIANSSEMLKNYNFGIKASHKNNNNKLAHTIHGNRRNLGYNYLGWNCDKGFLSQHKIEDLKIATEKYKPHVIGIAEIDIKRRENEDNENTLTFFSTEQVHSMFSIEGYKIILPDSWLEHNIARVIVYVKDDLRVKVKHLNVDKNHLQSILLEIGFGKSKPHLFNYYYREWKSCVRKSNQHQEEDLDHLLNIWRECTEDTTRDFVSIGDMNICAKKMDDEGYEHSLLAAKLKDFLLEENCAQLVDDYTRIRGVNGTIQHSALDHATVNCINKVTAPKLIAVGKSDHLGVFLTKTSREIRSKPRTIRKRIYKEFDPKAFREAIIQAKNEGRFDEIHSTSDESVACEVFEREFSRILNKFAPLRVIQNRSNYVPYLDKDTKKLMEERNELKELAAKTGDPETYEKYKLKRNLVSTKQKNAKYLHYSAKYSDPASTSSDIWNTTRQCLGYVRSNFPTQILHCGKLLSNPGEMASAVNEYFIDKIRILKSNSHVQEANLDVLDKFLSTKSVPAEGFEVKEVSTEALEKLFKKMKGKRSCGLDWICGYSLKLVAKDLIQELRILINLSIRNQRFTSQWKRAKILPGYKNKGNRFELKYYRPLSNLPEVSKLAEKVVYDQLYDYLDLNDLIHQNHHGFLRNRSTTTALQHMLDIWLKSMDNGKLVATLFLDLSAGFDVINHDILLEKMKLYKFSPGTIRFFESYLKNRTQSVQVESAISPPLPVPWGVPQGSILGPLLFLLFINELPELVKGEAAPDEDAEIVVYADDNTPSTAAEDPDLLEAKIQNEANIVTKWFKENDMICSADKTKLLILGTSKNRKSKLTSQGKTISVKVYDMEKEESCSECLLGMTVSNQLTWKHHFHGDPDQAGH